MGFCKPRSLNVFRRFSQLNLSETLLSVIPLIL
nr:MAG TPA: hypothetical protein [Caudoviricetes sp.]